MEGSFQHPLKLDFIPPFACQVEGAHQSGREKDGTSVLEGVPGEAFPPEAQQHQLSGGCKDHIRGLRGFVQLQCGRGGSRISRSQRLRDTNLGVQSKHFYLGFMCICGWCEMINANY